MLNRADFEMRTSSSSLIFRSRASARSLREIFLAMAQSSRLPILQLSRLYSWTVARATENLAAKRLFLGLSSRSLLSPASRMSERGPVQETNAVKNCLFYLALADT